MQCLIFIFDFGFITRCQANYTNGHCKEAKYDLFFSSENKPILFLNKRYESFQRTCTPYLLKRFKWVLSKLLSNCYRKKYCSNRLLFNNTTLDICKKKNLCLQEFRKCQCIYTPEAWLWRSARHFFDYVIVNCSNSSMAKCTIVDAIPKPRFL